MDKNRKYTEKEVREWTRVQCFEWLRWHDHDGDYEPDYPWDMSDTEVREFVLADMREHELLTD